MLKFKGSMLAVDYDGTLADSNGLIPDHVRNKIRYYTDNGGIFTVCTGRTAQGFHAFETGEFHFPALLANGVMAYDYNKKEMLFCFGIGMRDAEIVSDIINAFPEICVELYSTDFSSYLIRPNERSVGHLYNQSIAWREIADVREAHAPFVKIMLSCGSSTGGRIQRFLDESINRYDLRYIPSTGEYVEIIQKEGGKAHGMLKLADYYGIPHGKVFACGDGENDMEMLLAAGTGFAPENGCEKAKGAADHIVCSNDEGAVAQAIEIIEKMIS
jgi:Cof subfamily protein (haloacid dehalogenase superfamily)